jgi:hypothetical protein
VGSLKKTKNRKTQRKSLLTNPLKHIRSHPLSAYIALRRQKVKVGALKPAADGEVEFCVCVPDAVMVED